MKKTNTAKTEPHKSGFWAGLCLGVFCALFLATVLVYTYLNVGGFRIQLDRDRPAFFLRDQIKAEAFAEFNLFVEKLKLELPAAINRAFQVPESLFIPYEEGAVSLPPGMGAAAREHFQRLAVEAVRAFCNGLIPPLLWRKLARKYWQRRGRRSSGRWPGRPITMMSIPCWRSRCGWRRSRRYPGVSYRPFKSGPKLSAGFGRSADRRRGKRRMVMLPGKGVDIGCFFCYSYIERITFKLVP